MALWELLESRAAATPDADAMVERSGRRITFSELRDGSERMAAGLTRAGVEAGDVVAWELPTWIEAAELAFALHRLGTVQVPIIAIYRDREVMHCCGEAGARWFITTPSFRGFDFGAMAGRVAETTGVRTIIAERGAFPSGDPAGLPPPVLPPQAAWVFYTSGTTAAPKGARHTDATLAWVAARMGERMDLREGDRYAFVFPLPHIGGIVLTLCALLSGCVHLMDDAFDPAETPAFLARERVTHAGTGTPFHLAYLAAQRAQPAEVLFPHLRCCPGGAAPKPPTLHADVKRELGGVGIVSSWGLTEAPILTFSQFDDPDDKLATTEGRPLPDVELRVVEGELQVRGPQVMLGYVDSSLDADAFADGWLRTGDLGEVGGDGFVRITGRLKDVIVRNGENVSAKEVEDLLFTHPKVAEAAVVGLPDERIGERVCAAVVLAAANDPVSLGELRDHLERAGLRRQAIPEQLAIVDALPRNPAGKVTKQVLQEQLT